MSATETIDEKRYQPDGGPRKAAFTLAPHARMVSEDAADALDGELVLTPNPGTLPPDVYETTMGPYRAAARRVLVRSIAHESAVLARMQAALRTPARDKYFVYTSMLGTHTFFMMTLPGLFFFGHDEMGRGLVFVLAAGVYVSSFFKDLLCSPRPFAPPVTRLTIGTHHLEYGCPSTHSTNSVSVALLILEYLVHYHRAGALSTPALAASCAGLALYLCSIVFGRLYTAMHSFTDVAAGVLLGAACWAAHYAARDALAAVVTTGGWAVPALTVALGLVMVHKHPQPVDDCPCFEDAIAFVSVVLGIVLGWWHGARTGAALAAPVHVDAPWAVWAAVAALKLAGGVLAIFGWRLAAKAALHAALPPTFRALATVFALPHRRFYTPATDYGRVPGDGLRAIPSMVDLTALSVDVDVEEEDVLVQTRRGVREGVVRRRLPSEESGRPGEKERAHLPPVDVRGEDVTHYDADVLTKVGVYSGIGILTQYLIPVAIDALGLSAY